MPHSEPAAAEVALVRLLRQERASVLGVLTRYIRDFELAEDVLQDAVVVALDTWAQQGIPDNPRAWLLRVARNRAMDVFRRTSNFRIRQEELALLHEFAQQYATIADDSGVPDERLRLICLCCHPVLSAPDQLALTLRSVCGLTTAGIARALLVSESALAQRLVRAKRQLRDPQVVFALPEKAQWPARLTSVLSVIYLIFNEGYSASTHGVPARLELCGEALYLIDALQELLPDESEIQGLNALMHLHEARRAARFSASGRVLMLDEQDRARWDQRMIGRGRELVRQAVSSRRVGQYTLQAAISLEHASAASAGATDWYAIEALYGQLYAINASVEVKLNHAVAVSFARGTAAGLSAMPRVTEHNGLAHYQPYQAALANMHARNGDRPQAIAHCRLALKLSEDPAQRAWLAQRLQALEQVR